MINSRVNIPDQTNYMYKIYGQLMKRMSMFRKELLLLYTNILFVKINCLSETIFHNFLRLSHEREKCMKKRQALQMQRKPMSCAS